MSFASFQNNRISSNPICYFEAKLSDIFEIYKITWRTQRHN